MLDSIVSPLDGFRSPFGPQRGFNPARLFGLSDTGWFYDPNDLSTMFQDSAGTTPAAIVSPVGLMLDKSKGLVLGPELVTNGTFDTDLTGWTLAGTPNPSWSANAVAMSGTADLRQSFTTVAGRSYLLTFSVSGFFSSSFLNLGTNTGNNNLLNAFVPSSGRVIFTATTTTTHLRFLCSVSNSFSIDNISVRELPGNHSSQSTPSFRGVLQGSPSRLVLDGSDDRYVTTLNPASSGTIAARIRGATASCVVAGSQGATDGRAFLALAADGSIGAGIGAQSTGVIKGTVDKRNVWVTACVTWNGTTVRLYEDGVEVYSGAQSGAVNTTVPFIYGALNANGTASAFWDDDIGASLVISRAITAAEAAKLHNAWRNIA